MTKDVLVSAELAKEKLARIPEMWVHSKTCDPTGAPCTHQIMGAEVAQLIRNTDLTDCQTEGKQMIVDISPDQGSVRNATDSGTPSYEAIADMLPSMLTDASMQCPLCGQTGFHTHSPQEIIIYRNGFKYGRRLMGSARESASDAGSAINATDMRERCARVADAGAGESQAAQLVNCEITARNIAARIRALPDQKD